MKRIEKNKDNDIKNIEEPIKIDKINELINNINLNINKKEDDIKNIINEKDKVIKEMHDEIITLKNKTELINKKLEKFVDIFINEFKQKDEDINEIKINLYEKEILNNYHDKEIKNIYENIFKINDDIIKQKNYLLNELYKNNKDINLKINERINKNKEKLYNLEAEIFSLICEKEKNIKEIIEKNEKERKIELNKLICEEEIYRILKDEIAEIKVNEYDKSRINNAIEQYKKSLENKNDINKLKIVYEIKEKIYLKERKLEYLIKEKENKFEENIQEIRNIFEIKSFEIKNNFKS